jgi:hexosaminidase
VEMLKQRGKTAIGWDEVLEGARPSLAEDLVIMSWRGKEGGITASAKGHRVIMSSVTDGCYLNFKPLDSPEEPGHLSVCTVKQSYLMDPIPDGMTETQQKLVMGGQCNLWSEVIDGGRSAEYMLFPRLCAVSEALWSPKEARSLASFAARLPDHRKRLDLLDVNQYRGPLE